MFGLLGRDGGAPQFNQGRQGVCETAGGKLVIGHAVGFGHNPAEGAAGGGDGEHGAVLGPQGVARLFDAFGQTGTDGTVQDFRGADVVAGHGFEAVGASPPNPHIVACFRGCGGSPDVKGAKG